MQGIFSYREGSCDEGTSEDVIVTIFWLFGKSGVMKQEEPEVWRGRVGVLKEIEFFLEI
jgi:hypothetical protein